MSTAMKRTLKEIKEQTEKGQAFIERHPRSAFGADNKAQFEIFKRFTNLAKEGISQRTLGDIADREYDDENNTFAWDIITWLFEEENEDVYC